MIENIALLDDHEIYNAESREIVLILKDNLLKGECKLLDSFVEFCINSIILKKFNLASVEIVLDLFSSVLKLIGQPIQNIFQMTFDEVLPKMDVRDLFMESVKLIKYAEEESPMKFKDQIYLLQTIVDFDT